MTDRSKNRLTAGLTVASLVLLTILLGMFTRASRPDVGRRPSTFFTDDSGARAIYLVLQRLLPGAGQWRRPLTALPHFRQTNAATSLLALAPEAPLSPAEASALITWIAAGGQLVLVGEDGWRIAPQSGPGRRASPRDGHAPEQTKTNQPEPPGESFLGQFGVRIEGAAAPHRPLRGELTGAGAVAPVEVSAVTGFRWDGTYQVHARFNGEVLAAEIAHGQGRIIVLADAGFLSNRALRQADNAIWLVQLCAGWRNGRVLVDEYHHGFGQARGPGELTLAFLQTPWGWTVLQLLAAGALFALGFKRRMGRWTELPAVELRPSISLIDARGGLFQAARARVLAAELMVQQLGHILGAKWGRPEDAVQYCREPGRRHAAGPRAETLADLERVCLNCSGQSLPSEETLIRLGRISGQIYQELGHEHREH